MGKPPQVLRRRELRAVAARPLAPVKPPQLLRQEAVAATRLVPLKTPQFLKKAAQRKSHCESSPEAPACQRCPSRFASACRCIFIGLQLLGILCRLLRPK